MKPTEPRGPRAGDTKVCPYCAETIRAAAIKCRYCHSDLAGTVAPATQTPAPESAPTPEPAPAEPMAPEARTTTPAAEDEEKAPAVRRWRSARVPRPVVAVVLLLTLALLLLALRDWHERQEIEDATRAGDVARAAATDKVEALLSYRYKSFDEDVTAAQEMLTPSFRDEYAPTVAEIRKRALAQRRDQQAEVLAVGVVSADDDRVRTLVFVNTVSARQGSDRPATVMQNRVTVDLVRSEDGKDWLVDDLSFPSS